MTYPYDGDREDLVELHRDRERYDDADIAERMEDRFDGLRDVDRVEVDRFDLGGPFTVDGRFESEPEGHDAGRRLGH